MKTALSGGLVHAISADLAKVLNENRKAADLWESLTAIARNEFLCWIENAKQENTRMRRITRTVDELLQGQKRPCCWVGCIHRTDKVPSKWQKDVLIDRKPKR